MSRRSVLLAATAAVTVASAATVAVARRRTEAQGPGRLSQRLTAWEPASPRTALSRAAVYAWASPVTAAGLLVGAVSGVRPRRMRGVLVFAPVRGLVAAVLRRRRFDAGALGHVVVALDEPSPGLLEHEFVHVRQAERLGPLMAPVYLGLLAVHGYRRHPMELAAYRVARQSTAGGAPA